MKISSAINFKNFVTVIAKTYPSAACSYDPSSLNLSIRVGSEELEDTEIQSFITQSESYIPLMYDGVDVVDKYDVDRVTIKKVQDRIRPDGDETLKLNAELREMKIAVYALMKFINAVIAPGLTTAQTTALAPLLNQINTSIALTDAVIVIRDEGTAFKTANNL